MYCTIVLRNGQPIRAITSRSAARAHRIARHWKQRLRDTRAELGATYQISVTGGGTRARTIVGISQRGR